MKTKYPTKPKPQTAREWALYRVRLNCGLGKKALDGGPVPEGCNHTDYALYCLFNAVEEIAVAMEEEK